MESPIIRGYMAAIQSCVNIIECQHSCGVDDIYTVNGVLNSCYKCKILLYTITFTDMTP